MNGQDDECALLGPATLAAYLARLGVERPQGLDLAALTALQAAHLRAVPFHNLALLAAAGRDPGLPPVSAAIEGTVGGLGGTCHVLSPPFVVLLRSLGFEAHLAAASVGAQGDHLVVIVHIGGRRWLCDVANGHPYLRPFAIDPAADSAAAQDDQTAYGWRFRIESMSDATKPTQTHRVLRLLPDGTWKVVYSLDPQMVPYSAFARIIAEHHTQTGFGPFLTGLRAVRMTPERLLCLRDCWLERYGFGQLGRRFLPNRRAVGNVLSQQFGLGALPWQDALDTLEPQTRRWWSASTSKEIEKVAFTQAAPTLRLLVSVGLTDRPGGLWALGQGLLRDGLGAQKGPPGAGILAFENGSDSACVRDNLAAATALSAAGLPTQIGAHSLSIQARLLAAGLCAEQAPAPRVGIATSRMIQVGLLADFLNGPLLVDGVPQPPHPGDGYGPVAVWMLDDDLRLERLELARQGLTSAPLLNIRETLDGLYRDHPEISVLVGGNTGCPPIPGFCFLYTQILDLVAHIQSASQKDPEELYRPQTNPRHLPDYYYDTSDLGDAHLGLAFDWEPDAARGSLSVRAALLGHLKAFSNIVYGEPATRLLVHRPDLSISPTTARGGNAIFFDLDALFAAPYLSIRLGEAILSRRGDTVWAHLASTIPEVSIYQAPFPVHHTRQPGDSSGPSLVTSPGGHQPRHFILSQIGGVVLSRLVAAKIQGNFADPLALLEQRVGRVRAVFAAAIDLIACFEAARYGERTDLWWSRTNDVEIVGQMAGVTRVLGLLRDGVLSSQPATGVELETMAKCLGSAMANLDETLQHWRSLWT